MMRIPFSRLSLLLSVFVFAALLVSQGCRRDILYTGTDGKLRFSDDTVHFDTVFTTVGSVTLPLKLFNDYNDPISITSIQLAGGESSQFRMNVDGAPGTVFHDIEIPANDSIYVFVEVTVDPNADALPYVIEDSILFETNGNEQTVRLISWGQNAHFHYGQVISNDTTWTDDLPHVIIGSVLVDTLHTLTITEGTDIYLHGGSYFYVLGTLQVLGDKDSLVTFQGDRLEDFYKDVPGQWEGIYYLRGSFGNHINYAEIKNANDGIVMGYSTTPDLSYYLDYEPELYIDHTNIHDCQNNGLVALNSKITATNCLIYNIGLSNAALLLGGDYNFRYCTLANYSSSYLTHQTPSLGIADYFAFTQVDVLQDDLTRCDFTNCIIYGSIPEGNEVLIDTLDAVTTFNFNFNKCLLRTDYALTLLNLTDCFINQDPVFANIGERNYCPTTGSPALNAAYIIPFETINTDIRGEPRPYAGTLPDIGCYESSAE